MSGELFAVVLMGYASGACLMMALWSRIPPRRFMDEVSISVAWPAFFALFLMAAFVNSIVRALQDKNGEFAGLRKDSDWVREQEKEGSDNA